MKMVRCDWQSYETINLSLRISNPQFKIHIILAGLQNVADKNQDNQVTLEEWIEYFENVLQ